MMRPSLALAAVSALLLLITASASPAQVLNTSPQGDPAALKQVRESPKQITSTLTSADSGEALTKVLDQTGFSYAFDPVFYQNVTPKVVTQQGVFGGGLDLPPRSISMKLVNVPVVKALDSLTKAIGVGWVAESEGHTVLIRIVKLKSTVTASDMRRQQAGGFGGGGYGGGGFGGQNSVPLPAVRVGVARRDAPIRDVLGDVLRQAKLDFAVDEDVPADDKHSFTFENVAITTALDVVCQSAGLGWRAEQTPGGVLVRVGKRYAPNP
jgi:hypothetical protein